MHRFRIYLFLLLVTFVSYSHANETRILVLGDSLSAGYGINVEKGWVALLDQALTKKNSIKIINASVSGETTTGGKARLPQLLKSHQPQIVILELGGNDGLRGQPIAMIKKNLNEMIKMIDKTGAKTLLVGIQIPPNYGERYTQSFAAIYAQLADEYELSLVPFLLEGVATHSELMQNDGIHPTEAAQPQLLANVLPVLEKMLAP
jgi:acyl-CoA thioesterase I